MVHGIVMRIKLLASKMLRTMFGPECSMILKYNFIKLVKQGISVFRNTTYPNKT